MLGDNLISPTVATLSAAPALHSSRNDPNAALLPYFFNDSLLLTAAATVADLNDTAGLYSFVLNESVQWRNASGEWGIVGRRDDDAAAAAADVVALAKMIAMSVVLGLMILITIIGNVFVIAAIILERNLQNVANYLVASLAVADLFVACLVMPLGAVYEISQGWILGPELCDIWTSCDVLCCTASILHLVAIAADRYWTVTNIDYNNLRTPARVFFMIFCVWFAAVIVSLAPQFGWKDPEYMQRIEQQKCMVSQDVAYQIFATCCTFYVPLLIILVLYWKIYKIARKRIQRRSQQRPLSTTTTTAANKNQDFSAQREKERRLKTCFGSKTARTTDKMAALAVSNGAKMMSLTAAIAADTPSGLYVRDETDLSTSNYESKSHAGTEVTNVSSEADELRSPTIDDEEISTVSHQVATTSSIALHLTTPHFNASSTAAAATTQSQVTPAAPSHSKLLSSILNPHHKLAKRRQLLEAKRERKAAQTLAIITGAFALCWLPFFVMALLLSLCKSCQLNAAVASLFLWLGYFNSTLNPIIYTIFNPEFRRAFQRILYGRQRNFAHCPSGKL